MVQVRTRRIPGVYMAGYGEFDIDSWYTNHSEPPTCAEMMAEAKKQALSNVDTQAWVFTGFGSYLDPVFGDALWGAGTESYEVFHSFGGNTNPPSYADMKFNLYVARGENINMYAHYGCPQFAEIISAEPTETNGFSGYEYGETGFIKWPNVDCSNYTATAYETGGYGPPIAYVEFSDLKYQ